MGAKVIKRFILHAKKTGFVVEHDFIMATYLADRVVVYEGTPAKECWANAPQTLLSGMNQFLQQLEITFRRDPTNYRPRINKGDSLKDKSVHIPGCALQGGDIAHAVLESSLLQLPLLKYVLVQVVVAPTERAGRFLPPAGALAADHCFALAAPRNILTGFDAVVDRCRRGV